MSLIGCDVQASATDGSDLKVQTAHVEVQAESVVIATGDLSIPQIGATDFG